MFTELLLKYGNVGSTARTNARLYHKFAINTKDRIEILKKIIEFRYKFGPQKDKQQMLERMSYLDNLTDVTFSMLQIEGAIKTKGMPLYLQMAITSTIMKELEKKNVPSTMIVGENTI